MCKKCKNNACSQAGKHNAFMGGKKHVCAGFDNGEPKPERDYQQEWLEGMKDFSITGLPI